ncbi:AMP-dependent synthetase [Actibacterium mucosum KCTC 23349]|uniref:AMP-dependent synthetase n=1 Tax=Actibacterium mucosum KCTC 23349 TaxID=1454373 RepID=A0A037ZIX5_9RHOB|nr:AMP-dependent synthetase [Actibacterium mucosum KCTC 23349]
MLPQGQTWDQMMASFRWPRPEYFNIAERCCDSWADEDPGRVALIDASDGDRVWTYGALRDASDRLASMFAGQGIGKGDVIAVLLPQGPAVLVAHFAAYKLGAVVLPLFSLFGPDALQYRLSDSRSRLVIADNEGAAKVAGIRDALPDLRGVMSVEERFWEAITAAPPISAAVQTRAEDPAVLIYTSGTTGAPKGVLHAHQFLLGHLPSIELTHRRFPQPGDCGWTPADWAWIGGLMDLAMPCLYYGVPLVSQRMRKFDATAAWDLIARLRVQNLFLPPTALKLMRQVPVPSGVQVRSITSGGEALGAELLAWGRDALGVEISEIYGQTECNLVAASVPGEMVARPGALGRAVPGFVLSLRDADGAVVAPGQLGEICVRRGPPDMMLEYLNKPAATAGKFHGDWLRTGDMAVEGADGLLTFVARDDDVITSAGYRIGPAEIEAALGAHPDVVMAGVVGAPDAARTEIVVAHVVLRDGVARDGLEEVLRDWVAQRVSPHVAPRRVVWAESLPMTATGKILRRALRQPD